MTLGIEREGLAEPLRELRAPGTPILGTCAGLIMLDREHLGLMDIVARRNAFGRQVALVRGGPRLADLDGEPVRAVFIRAPWVEEHGAGVEMLAEVDGHPVAAREGDMLAVAFHPELTGDTRLHEALPRRRASRREARASDDEPVADRVLGHDPRLDELQQVVRAAGLRAGARQPVAAERLAADHRAGDRAVDVEVADRRAARRRRSTVRGLRANRPPVSA